MAPADVSYENTNKIQKKLYVPKHEPMKCNFSVGDKVRIDINKAPDTDYIDSNNKKRGPKKKHEQFRKGYEARM